jgi:hypothetical protein
MEQLIRDIERTARLGFTPVTELLLDLTSRERKQFAALLRKHEKTSLSAQTFETPHGCIEVWPNGGYKECTERAVALANTVKKPAVVLALKPRNISVSGWGHSAPIAELKTVAKL